MTPSEEQRHLNGGCRSGERPAGVGTVSVVARCRGDASRVAERSREVLQVVLAHAGPPWPAVSEWRQVLPAWFVNASAPERPREEAEQWLGWWRSLPPEEQARVTRSQRWALADWLYWLEPSERQWFWWDAVVESPEILRVIVQVSGWPAPLGALDWLLRAAGAVEVLHENHAKA